MGHRPPIQGEFSRQPSGHQFTCNSELPHALDLHLFLSLSLSLSRVTGPQRRGRTLAVAPSSSAVHSWVFCGLRFTEHKERAEGLLDEICCHVSAVECIIRTRHWQ